MQRQTRVENEFNASEMGPLLHSAFLAESERMLIALVDAGVGTPEPATLYRRYLQKLSPELRTSLLTHAWVDTGPPRRPETRQECTESAAQELEGRADAKALREMVNG